MISFAMLLLADIFYTYIYLNSYNRNKIQFVFNSEPQKYDLIILGSSRANNHFDAEMFNKKGIKTFNYGMSGSRLSEDALFLELMIERNYKIKNIILEVDLNINTDGFSEGTRACFMPYIHNSKTIKKYYKDLPNFNKVYYIPFYRYINYESKIGFREMFFASIHKKSKDFDHFGYYPLYEKNSVLKLDISKYYPKKNKSYELIKKICQQNNINLITLTTPICTGCNNREYFKNVKKLYPEIHNYENIVTDDKYFSSCGHMNDKGAKIFTSKIISDFFKN
ncbi:hypothetical protein [Flavobacterium sp.]|uniref:hypothetical protein n=1 Tax=Flavobacterium sp. TaxID=239 RepID=UPI003753C9AE